MGILLGLEQSQARRDGTGKLLCLCLCVRRPLADAMPAFPVQHRLSAVAATAARDATLAQSAISPQVASMACPQGNQLNIAVTFAVLFDGFITLCATRSVRRQAVVVSQCLFGACPEEWEIDTGCMLWHACMPGSE